MHRPPLRRRNYSNALYEIYSITQQRCKRTCYQKDGLRRSRCSCHITVIIAIYARGRKHVRRVTYGPWLRLQLRLLLLLPRRREKEAWRRRLDSTRKESNKNEEEKRNVGLFFGGGWRTPWPPPLSIRRRRGDGGRGVRLLMPPKSRLLRSKESAHLEDTVGRHMLKVSGGARSPN